MKPKADFDPEIAASWPRRSWPFRSIWQLMAVVAASAILLAISVTLARQPRSSAIVWKPALAVSGGAPQLVFYPGPADAYQILAAAPEPSAIAYNDSPPVGSLLPSHPLDRSVVLAPESIDPQMVVRASEWIDPKMVFVVPDANGQPGQGGSPATGLPGIAPRMDPRYNLFLVPEGSLPDAKMPQYKLVPVPDGSIPPAKKSRK